MIWSFDEIRFWENLREANKSWRKNGWLNENDSWESEERLEKFFVEIMVAARRDEKKSKI